MRVGNVYFTSLQDALNGERLLNLAGILILCGLYLFWDLGRAIYLLTSLFAIYYLVRYKPRLPRIHWLYGAPILVFFSIALLSLVYHDASDRGGNFLTSRYGLLLFAIPLVGLAFSQYTNHRNQWFKFIAACWVLAIISLYDVLVRGEYRASAGDNAAIFGFSAAMMSCVLFASYFGLRQSRAGLALYLSGLASGGIAVVLSGTRGAWIAILFAFMVTVFAMFDRLTVTRRISIMLVSIVLVLGLGMMIPQVKNRVDLAILNLSPYLNGEEITEFNNVSYRIESWRASWHIGRENLLLGVGPGNYRSAIRAYVEDKPRYRNLVFMSHAHNQYMQVFATMGLVGLIAFVCMLLAHLVLFAGFLLRRYPGEVRGYALAGFLLVSAYALLCVTGVPLDRKKHALLYGFASASLLGCMLGALERHRGRNPSAGHESGVG